jgi:SNF2 family DNA or RNA helicase
MTTLYPKQESHAKVVYRALLLYRAALDTSQTGVGKTPMSCHIASHWQSLGKPVAVVCPKSVVTNWKRTLEDHGVTPLFVNNYEKLRNGSKGVVRVKRQRKQRGSGKVHKWFEWEIPEDTLLIFDEVQWCKGHYTQNGNLLIAAKKQNITTLSLSATAAKDPTEMRALGFALGLHELNEGSRNNSFFHWMQENGCYKDPWKNWKARKDADLSCLNRELFSIKEIASGLKTSDMPGAFKNQRIITNLGDYKGASDLYKQAGLTEGVIDSFLDNISQKKKEAQTVITDILRARQYVEMLKVTHFVERTNDLLNEGKSVVVFLNFRESIEAFREAFPGSGVIIGQQKDRDQQLDDWSEDKKRVIAVSAQAGGTGVSLHDQRGKYPRVAIISPTFSVQTYKQVLGRCYRVGMKTDLTQIVMVAANTIEEYVHAKCLEGVGNMESMLQ